VTGILLSEK